MYSADIELSDSDFEFAKPPLSKEFIITVFQKFRLGFIAYFGENMFYVSSENFEPLPPLYPDGGYPEEIELVFDFMTRERIRRIRSENGILFRTSISKVVNSNFK
ncbi:MAG: hypothetical protein ACPK85_10420 [Methanosarcina sp.]